jgi:invasion protein IalB
MFQSHWVGLTAAVVLILTSLAAVFYSGRPAGGGPGRVALPAIQQANIEPGFVGQHRFGLWTLICEDAAATPAPVRLCRANARMTVRGPNNAALLAAAFNIVMMKSEPRPGMLFRLPPAASAADSVNFAVDANTMFQAPLKCSKTECLAQGALPEHAIEQMRNGRTLSLIYTVEDRAQKERKVRVDQLLHGFRESYDAMTRAMAG